MLSKVELLKKIFLFYLLISCVIVNNGLSMARDDREKLAEGLSVEELLSHGFKYLVFGSQNTDGIEIYDFKKGNFVSLLIPEQKEAKQREARYLEPIVGMSGKGFCIKEKDIFNFNKKEGQLITFDLKTFKSNSTGIRLKQIYANLAISSNEKWLASVYFNDANLLPVLGIISTNEQKIKKEFPVDKRFYDNPIVIFWTPDNNNIILWDTITGHPAIEIDTSSGSKSTLNNFPLDMKDNIILLENKENNNIIVMDSNSQQQKQTIIKQNSTGHSFKLSNDGQYMVFGWLSGFGFETLSVMELSSKISFNIKLKNHASTVLGLSLWYDFGTSGTFLIM